MLFGAVQQLKLLAHNGEERVAQAYKDEVARLGYTEGHMLRMTQQRNILDGSRRRNLDAVVVRLLVPLPPRVRVKLETCGRLSTEVLQGLKTANLISSANVIEAINSLSRGSTTGVDACFQKKLQSIACLGRVRKIPPGEAGWKRLPGSEMGRQRRFAKETFYMRKGRACDYLILSYLIYLCCRTEGVVAGQRGSTFSCSSCGLPRR
jgi:hypothetical protein